MPRQSGPSGFNFNESLARHATDPVDYGQDFTNLPGGITGGLAVLSEAKMGVYKSGNNKGEKYVYLAGTVVEPEYTPHVVKVWEADPKSPSGGVVKVVSAVNTKVRGLFTKQTIPLCETKTKKGKVTTADENVATLVNEIGKLAGEGFKATIVSEEALVQALEHLKVAAPKFRFTTEGTDPTQEYPNPMTFEKWRGAVTNAESNGQAPAGGMSDGTPEGGNDAPEEAAERPDKDMAGSSEGADAVDLDELAKMAEKGSAKEQHEAGSQLEALAKSLGMAQAEFDPLSWPEVVAYVREKQVGAGGAPEGPPEPQVGEVWVWTRRDPKNPKKVLKVEVEVTASDAKAKTITAKSNVDKKTIPDSKNPKKAAAIGWDELSLD